MIAQAVVVGFFAVPTALFGLYYNATTMQAAIRGAFEPMLNKFDAPYFYQAFAIMSAITSTKSSLNSELKRRGSIGVTVQ